MRPGKFGFDPWTKRSLKTVRLDTVPDVARFVRELRLHHGLNRGQLAERAGLSERSLARFELGQTLDYSLGRVQRVLRVLGVRLVPAPGSARPNLDTLLEEVKAGRNTGPNSR
jgi:transcriptional regulator with XRE-family HTH domain